MPLFILSLGWRTSSHPKNGTKKPIHSRQHKPSPARQKNKLGSSVKKITYATPKLPRSLWLYLGSSYATKSNVAHFVCQQFSSDGNVTCFIVEWLCTAAADTQTKLAQLFTLTGLGKTYFKQLELPLQNCFVISFNQWKVRNSMGSGQKYHLVFTRE